MSLFFSALVPTLCLLWCQPSVEPQLGRWVGVKGLSLAIFDYGPHRKASLPSDTCGILVSKSANANKLRRLSEINVLLGSEVKILARSHRREPFSGRDESMQLAIWRHLLGVGVNANTNLLDPATGTSKVLDFVSKLEANVISEWIKLSIAYVSQLHQRPIAVDLHFQSFRSSSRSSRCVDKRPKEQCSTSATKPEAPSRPISRLFSGVGSLPLSAQVGLSVILSIGASLVLWIGVVRSVENKKAAFGNVCYTLLGISLLFFSACIWEFAVVRG